jgi:hypothetical protein
MNMIGMGSFLKCGKKGKRVEKGRVNGVKGLEVLMGERGLGIGSVREKGVKGWKKGTGKD